MMELGGFEILGGLAEGGMGEVLLARRRGVHGFEKLIALKTLKADLAARSDIRAMFLDEARLVAALVHPAIAQVHDFGEAEGKLYLAMEYVAGVPFSTWTEPSARPALPPVIAAKMIAEVCRGLHAAHEQTDANGRPLDVVHRDVSPQNLFFTFSGYVKILDFGIAKMRHRSAPATMIGQIKGKLMYLSPEQVSGAAVDRRTDVYAVSVVLFELLTGKPLYAGKSTAELGGAILFQPAPAPSTIIASIPGSLDRIVLRGLQKEPERRFPTARAMADELDAVVSALGGCSLEVFAEQALAGELEKHKTKILRLATGDPGAIASSEKRRMTVVDGDSALAPTWPSDPSAHDTLPSDPPVRLPLPELAQAPALPETAPGAGSIPTGVLAAEAGVLPRRRGLIGAVLVGLLATGAVAAAVSLRITSTATTPAVIIETIGSEGSSPSLEPRLPEAPAAAAAERAVAAPNSAQPMKAHKERPAQTHRPPRERPVDRQKVAPPEQATNAPPGYLTIGAQPYAIVWIDGKSIGPTPLVDHALAPGDHVIKCLEPDTDRVRLEREISIGSGERRSLTVR
jgi:eukaryotic-like serine/threonine-protein kinase